MSQSVSPSWTRYPTIPGISWILARSSSFFLNVCQEKALLLPGHESIETDPGLHLDLLAVDHGSGELFQTGVEAEATVSSGVFHLDQMRKRHISFHDREGHTVVGSHIENRDLHGSLHLDGPDPSSRLHQSGPPPYCGRTEASAGPPDSSGSGQLPGIWRNFGWPGSRRPPPGRPEAAPFPGCRHLLKSPPCLPRRGGC